MGEKSPILFGYTKNITYLCLIKLHYEKYFDVFNGTSHCIPILWAGYDPVK